MAAAGSMAGIQVRGSLALSGGVGALRIGGAVLAVEAVDAAGRVLPDGGLYFAMAVTPEAIAAAADRLRARFAVACVACDDDGVLLDEDGEATECPCGGRR